MGCVPDVIVGRLKFCPHLQHFSFLNSDIYTTNDVGLLLMMIMTMLMTIYVLEIRMCLSQQNTTKYLLSQVVNLAVEVNKVNIKL